MCVCKSVVCTAVFVLPVMLSVVVCVGELKQHYNAINVGKEWSEILLVTLSMKQAPIKSYGCIFSAL